MYTNTIMQPFSWRCPFCQHNATITASNYSSGIHPFNNGSKYGEQAFVSTVITCPNPQCREVTIRASLNAYGAPAGGGPYQVKQAMQNWRLVPAAEMRVLPEYVPDPIVADYKEASLIRDLSPKASATLARRCLQGMIRDFHGISKSRLVDEIDAIKEKVDPLTWSAIEAVRHIGNIGAHMERDINVVIDVDPDEARLLLGLIETLVEDWYVARHERQERLTRLVSVADQKAEARKKPSQGSADAV